MMPQRKEKLTRRVRFTMMLPKKERLLRKESPKLLNEK